MAALSAALLAGCANGPESAPEAPADDEQASAVRTPLDGMPVGPIDPFDPGKRKSVIVLDIDTLRADGLGVYGSQRPTSPTIDALAADSALFAWTFSQAPNTPPSQASILTGLYPTSHRRILDEQVLPDSAVTLAEAFAEAGYDTAAFVDGGLMAGEFGIGQGFDTYDDEAGGLLKIGPKVKTWLSDRGKSAEGRDDPFLLLVHTYDVHSPYDSSPEPFRSMFLDEIELPSEDFQKHITWRSEQRRQSRYSENPTRLSDVEVAYSRALYDGGIRYVDDWIRRFLDFLDQQSLLDDTIIVLISDHGDEFEEHNSVFHEVLYSPVTRVPMIIRFPGNGSRGVYPQVVETIDLMPTLLDAVGVDKPSGLHGRSLMPLLRGEASSIRQHAVSESPFFGRRIVIADAEHRMFFSEEYGSRELYAFRSDPLELEDLAAEKLALTGSMLDDIERWKKLVAATSLDEAAAAEIDEETRAQLIALGYIDG